MKYIAIVDEDRVRDTQIQLTPGVGDEELAWLDAGGHLIIAEASNRDELVKAINRTYGGGTTWDKDGAESCQEPVPTGSYRVIAVDASTKKMVSKECPHCSGEFFIENSYPDNRNSPITCPYCLVSVN